MHKTSDNFKPRKQRYSMNSLTGTFSKLTELEMKLLQKLKSSNSTGKKQKLLSSCFKDSQKAEGDGQAEEIEKNNFEDLISRKLRTPPAGSKIEWHGPALFTMSAGRDSEQTQKLYRKQLMENKILNQRGNLNQNLA